MTGLLLSLSLTFTALFQNQVEWHLYASWWFSWHMLSNMKDFPENFSWCRSSDLFRRFFWLTSTFCLSFLHLNFTITDFFLFKQWQAGKWSSLTSCLVKESAWQMFSSSSSSLMEGQGLPPLILADYTEHLVTAFLSIWTTLSVNSLLQFLAMANSDETTSDLLKKSLNWFFKSDIFDVIDSDEFFNQFFFWEVFQLTSCLNHFSRGW